MAWHDGPCDLCHLPAIPTGATRCMVVTPASKRRDGRCGAVFLRCANHGGNDGSAVAAVRRHQDREHPLPVLAKEAP